MGDREEGNAKSRPLELAWNDDDCRRTRRGASRIGDGDEEPCGIIAVESRTPRSSFEDASIAAMTVQEDRRDASPIARRIIERMAKRRRRREE